MLYFDRIDVFESKEFDICHYWYFLNKGFKLQPHVCNKCHDVLMMSMTLLILLFQTLKMLAELVKMRK